MGQCVFVFYCCITNCHKFSSLKKHSLIILQVTRSKILVNSVGFSVLRFNAEVYCFGWIRLSGSPGEESHFQTHSGCWQNEVPYDCRSEVFLSAVSQGPLSAPTGCLYSFSPSPIFKTASELNPPHTATILGFAFCSLLEKDCLLLKSTCDSVRPTRYSSYFALTD